MKNKIAILFLLISVSSYGQLFEIPDDFKSKYSLFFDYGGYVFIASILLFFAVKIFKRHRCAKCNRLMEREVNDDSEIIYKCWFCKTTIKTGIRLGD